jgi:hypothetical protein
MNYLKKFFAAISILSAMGAAQAAVISGTLNSIGYDLIKFHVDTTTTVDFQNPTGITDASFALFNSVGSLLIFADDSSVGGVNSLKPRLTQNLAAGKYSLLITSCCAAIGEDWIFKSTDGFNTGSFYKSSTATLSSIKTALSEFPQFGGAAYQLTATNAIIEVPEPGSLALFASSMAALLMVGRRKERARKDTLMVDRSAGC